MAAARRRVAPIEAEVRDKECVSGRKLLVMKMMNEQLAAALTNQSSTRTAKTPPQDTFPSSPEAQRNCVLQRTSQERKPCVDWRLVPPTMEDTRWIARVFDGERGRKIGQKQTPASRRGTHASK